MKTTKVDDSKTYIVLPAAGYVAGIYFKDVGSKGRYWSGTAGTTSNDAYILRITNVSVLAQNNYNRHFGLPVRPVRLVEVSQSQQ